MKKFAKVDVRLEKDLRDRLDFIVEEIEAKRSSWVREAIRMRIEKFFEDEKMEEKYNEWSKKRENKRVTGEDNKNDIEKKSEDHSG